mmetsp:Transcript_126042/g.199809  ORF Transcript_126042/g.199809 Transcript_126042/m.199809 type:complete len:527 (-) Transcript_126042:275-1855(-)
MGQSHFVGGSSEEDLAYRGYSTQELQQIAVDRNLDATRRQGLLQADRATLLALLKAYDTGLQAANGLSSPDCSDFDESCWHVGRATGSDDSVEQRILDYDCHKGADIGGTLIKVALALPNESDFKSFPDTFGATGRTRPDLAFDFELRTGRDEFRLKFISGATAQVEQAISKIRQRREKIRGTLDLQDIGFRPANSQDPSEGFALRKPNIGEGLGYSVEAPSVGDGASPRDTTSGKLRKNHDRLRLGNKVSLRLPHETKTLYTAGGGAHKFSASFRDNLNVRLEPVKELQSVVDGLLFMNTYGKTEDSLYVLTEENRESFRPWPEPLFPFIIVNMGSGVSILRVDSASQDDFVRIGGTACGGSTFLGLARALTSAKTFQEALKLAEAGDAAKCDLLVHDIYGEEGSAALGLPGKLTAANFGRLCEAPGDDKDLCSENDIARSILQMVTQQSVLLSSAYAKQAGCVDRVFFAGGFVEEENRLARVSIAANFRNLGGCAYFLKHADYLGSLGALRACMRADHASPRCG